MCCVDMCTDVDKVTMYTPRYGAQHPIVVHNDLSDDQVAEYVVVGHCCESGDLFSCAPGDPEVLKTRLLKQASIGDIVTIEGSGAYCSGMSTKNYNSFPEAAEVIIDQAGVSHLIRRLVLNKYQDLLLCYVVYSCSVFVYRRQTLDQIIQNEIPYKK